MFKPKSAVACERKRRKKEKKRGKKEKKMAIEIAKRINDAKKKKMEGVTLGALQAKAKRIRLAKRTIAESKKKKERKKKRSK